ncbi:MAG: alpha-galactosidase, partial [Thermoguttaceae bacterium]
MLIFCGLLGPLATRVQSASFATWNQDELTLDNGIVSRRISFDNESVRTVSLKLAGVNRNFVTAPQAPGQGNMPGKNARGLREFSFTLNDKPLDGSSGWKLVGIEACKIGGGNGAIVSLDGNGLHLQITYVLYPNLPVIRKKIKIANRSLKEVKIENFDVESLPLTWENTQNVVYRNFARYKWLGPFIGNWDDPVVAVQRQDKQCGMLLGNEAPGITKRTSCCLDGQTITIGLTHADQDYPFRAWLSHGEQWESPWSFVIPYQGVNPTKAIEGPLADYVREYMGLRLAELKDKPIFVYNTWVPFRRNINEKLVMALADAAASCGVKEFVIDDGWQQNFGDWAVDRKKFPRGLKPVFDYIKAKGMKPGLWLSLATMDKESNVYRAHPEWSVRDKNGHPIFLHSALDPNKVTACMTSGWKDHIKGVILKYVNEYGLEYVKLDFAIVTSAYVFDRGRSGCYAKGHPHKDRPESLLEIYRSTWKLFDELHAEAPKLFIDCSFEAMGAMQAIDLDMCKHAEGDWLSNFYEKAPLGSLRVRQMAWWRGGVMPAAALVLGNQRLDDP